MFSKNFRCSTLAELCLAWIVVWCLAFGASQILIQAANGAQEANNDSAPIYLEEPEPEPAARVARRQTVKDTYEDKTIRTERDIVLLSDDRVINDGKYIEYYRDGKKYVEGNYKMGVFEGGWHYWFPNGQLCKKVSFKNGKPDGQWEEFNQAGVRTAQKGYQNGMRHGKWLHYHEDGEVLKFEISYEHGLPVGERITYFDSGQKRQSIRYQEGQMNGPMVIWDNDGNVVAEATLKAGKVVGKIKRFDVE